MQLLLKVKLQALFYIKCVLLSDAARHTDNAKSALIL